MRILMVLTYYYPHWTGLTAFAQRMAEGLAARGHQVTVLTSRYSRSLATEDAHNGVRIVRVPSWFRLSRGQVMPALVPALRRLVPVHDVVQVHTPMVETWLVAAMAHRAGRQVLMTHHGDLVMPKGLWNQTVQRTVGWLLSQGARSVDRISMYTRDYIDHSEFLRPHRAKVVPVYPPVIFPRPDRAEAERWRCALGIDGAPLVGFAGRFVEEKGFDHLLQAIPRLVERHPGVRLAFAGETNVVYEAFYRRCLPLIEAHRDRLVMLGLITDPQRMADFYSMCDVFALPSRTDCLASVQIEAMLCGTPVVATNIPGAREVVRVTGMGLLVEPCSERALAEGLAAVLDEPGRYHRSYETIQSIFDPDKAIRDYEALLGEMAAARHEGHRHGASRHVVTQCGGSDPAARPRLDVLLRNESDMAYRRRVRRMIAYLDLAPGQTLLDCGTGMGFYLKVVSDLCPGCRLYGLDCEDGALRYALGHLRERGVVLARGDIHHLPYADASMDRVLMSEVLEHLENDAEALDEVRRVLKPGGILAMTVPHARYSYWYDPINRIHEALLMRPIRTGPFAGIWANHHRLYDAAQLQEVVTRAGFLVERVEELTHYCFPGTQTIVYTLGKGLIDYGLLPGFLARSTHRFQGEANNASRLNPINWVLGLFDRIDRFNEDEERMARVNTYANVALKARKPS